MNDKVRLCGTVGQALLEAKQSGRDPFAAIEGILSWEEFAASTTEASGMNAGKARKLPMTRPSHSSANARPSSFSPKPDRIAAYYELCALRLPGRGGPLCDPVPLRWDVVRSSVLCTGGASFHDC